MSELLNTLIHDARLWQGHQRIRTAQPAEPTGYPALDEQLSGLGWPRGALSECLLSGPGIGELQLVLPLMRRLTEADKTVFWVSPPQTPYAPALARQGIHLDNVVVIRTKTDADHLWTLENCLRSPVTGLVLAWPARLTTRAIRRLQLAAEASSNICILFRPDTAASHSSPAALRLSLAPGPQRTLSVHILKQRGSWAGQQCALSMAARAPQVEQTLTQQVSPVIPGPWTQTQDQTQGSS